MASLNTATASEVGRYSYIYRGRLVCRAWRSDGTILERDSHGWHVVGRAKNGYTYEDAVARLRDGERDGVVSHVRLGRAAWVVPGYRTLEKMAEGTAKAPDGCTVEPDGTCPHGIGSWLLLTGMI